MILDKVYQLIGIIYMPSVNHFNVSIYNYQGHIAGLENSRNYFYDGLIDDGKIVLIDGALAKRLNSYIKHLFIYAKK